LKVRIKNTSPHPLPAYQTLGAAGMDICANLSSPIILHPFERTLIPTGIYMELPQGVEAQIRPRSGLAIKKASPASIHLAPLIVITVVKFR
jgi:dUTP pyrophosphatase